jgi:hypothetical protein
MLTIVSEARETDDEPSRTVFRDRHLDLVVWRREGVICGFELCYGNGTEWARTVRWTIHDDVALLRVETFGVPLLIAAQDILPAYLLEEFAIRARFIEDDIRCCVMKQLEKLHRRTTRLYQS